MKTLNTLKLKIMVRAFKIRLKNGEFFEDIAYCGRLSSTHCGRP